MFKIGEFSKMVRVSPRMLRYYEQNGVLSPAYVDCSTGYRLYSSEQMPLLFRVTLLRDMGFGVEEIKTILPRFGDIVFMGNVLNRKKQEIENSIAAEQDKLRKIAAAEHGLFEKEKLNMIFEVEIKALPAEKVLTLTEVIPSYDMEGILWEKLGAFVHERGISAEVCGYSIYHDDDYKESDVTVEIAVKVAELGSDEGGFQYKVLPAIAEAATIRFSGPYDGYYEATEKLARWVEANGYTGAGLMRGLAIKSFGNAESPADFLTEIQAPVKKA